MDKKEVALSFKFPVELHKALKVLAAKVGKTIKQCLLDGLDAAFPDWRKQEEK